MVLKFGLEIEFMVAYPATDRFVGLLEHMDDRWPEGQRPVDRNDPEEARFAKRECIYKIASIVAGLGYPVACLDRSLLDESERVTAVYGGELRQVGDERWRIWNRDQRMQHVGRERFSYWFIDQEGYITSNFVDNYEDAMPPGGYEWFNVELVSPVLGDNQEIAAGLPTVRRILGAIRSQTKIWLNDDCGFHLHASPILHDLDVQTARSVAALTFLLEKMLYTWCHPNRYDFEFGRSLQRDSAIGRALHNVRRSDDWNRDCINIVHKARKEHTAGFMPNETEFFQKVCTILEQPTVHSLQAGLHESFNGQQVISRLGLCVSGYDTLEFRYPEARFDMEFVSFWVEIVSALFTFAQDPREQFAAKLAEFYVMAVSCNPVSPDLWLITLGLGRYSRFVAELRRRYQNEWRDLNAAVILRRPEHDPR